MARPKSSTLPWFAHGPLGAWGRKLGFRWAFPVGTMPVPYHRAIPLLLLGAPVVWLAISLARLREDATGGSQWPWMILAGLLLAIPLSIPIVNWAFRIFGGFLVQGLLFAAAMIALAGEVVAGRAAMAWAALPVGYVLAYAWQRGSGLLRVRRYRRLLTDFVPVSAAGRTLLLPSDRTWIGVAALRQRLATRAFIAAPSAQLVERIEQDEAEILQAIRGKSLPRGWRIEPADGHAILMRPADPPQGPTLAIAMERFGRRIGNWPGLVRWRVVNPDGQSELVTGSARIAGPLPLIVLFCAIPLTGGRSEWFAGFAPGDARLTTKEADDPSHVLAKLETVPPRSEAQREALLAETRAAFAADEARDRAQAAERADLIRKREAAGLPTRVVSRHGVAEITGRADPALFWREIAADPSRWVAHRSTYLTIAAKAAACDREDLRRTLNWLEAAIQVRARDAIVAAAKLLAAMEQPLLASDYARLMTLLNSRVLGLVWRLTPDFDVKPLPPKVPKFGDEAGFGLIRSVPELYLKLADLGPEMEDMIVKLVEEAIRYGVSLPPALAAMAQPRVARE